MNRETIEMIQGLDELAAEGIDTLLVRIEKIQRTYSHVPYAVLERIPLIGGPAREIERVQDGITHAVYGTIRGVNWLIGTGVSLALDQVEKRMD